MKLSEYSAENRRRILAAKPDASELEGYRGWNRRGRRIRPGTRGITIYANGKALYVWDITDTTEGSDDAS